MKKILEYLEIYTVSIQCKIVTDTCLDHRLEVFNNLTLDVQQPKCTKGCFPETQKWCNHLDFLIQQMIRKVDSNSDSEMRLKDNNNENYRPLLCLLCNHYTLQKAYENGDASYIAIKTA